MSRAARPQRQQQDPMRSAGRNAARAIVGLAGAAVGSTVAGRTSRWLGPVRVSARVVLTPAGGVRVDIPPVGSATLATHRGPLQVRIVATDVDPSRAEGLLRMPKGEDDSVDVRAQLQEALADAGKELQTLGLALVARCVAGGLGGATLFGAVALRRPRDATSSAGIAAAAIAGAAALAALTADREAWRDPRLAGLLTKAPLLLGDLRTAPQRIDTYRYQLADLLRTGTGVYRKIATLPAPPPGDAIRLLHISDIHLSPAAYPLARALVDEYRVDAVIDTGDLVDWGTPAEQAFAGQVGDLGVPYVFVKGNHDSDGIAQAVAKQANATVLELGDEPVEVAGIRFAGMADPRFTPDKTTGDDHAAHRVSDKAKKFAEQLHRAPADIALAHDPAAGRALDGVVPLLLAGHTHQRAVRRYGDTTVLIQGTTGGSGLRGVQHDPPHPISLSVVYIERGTKRLWGVDEVTLGGLGSVTLSVVRKSAADLLAQAQVQPPAPSTGSQPKAPA